MDGNWGIILCKYCILYRSHDFPLHYLYLKTYDDLRVIPNRPHPKKKLRRTGLKSKVTFLCLKLIAKFRVLLVLTTPRFTLTTHESRRKHEFPESHPL